MSVKKIVLGYGLGSGALLAVMTAVMIPLCMTGRIPFDSSRLIGYTTMVLSFLLVFFGIRAYRDDVAGGAIGFGRAFQVGILMTLITSAVYVIGWEIVYWGFYPDFLDRYAAYSIETMRARGETEAAIREAQAEMAKFAVLYRNPLFNAAITFMEVFPVGLVVTLVSAAILRRRAPGEGGSAAPRAQGADALPAG